MKEVYEKRDWPLRRNIGKLPEYVGMLKGKLGLFQNYIWQRNLKDHKKGFFKYTSRKVTRENLNLLLNEMGCRSSLMPGASSVAKGPV